MCGTWLLPAKRLSFFRAEHVERENHKTELLRRNGETRIRRSPSITKCSFGIIAVTFVDLNLDRCVYMIDQVGVEGSVIAGACNFHLSLSAAAAE